MTARKVHAIRINIQSMQERSVIVWPADTAKLCIQLMNPRLRTLRTGHSTVMRDDTKADRWRRKMPRQMSTIIATTNGKKHKLLKIWFGGDGSFYVSAPYHPSKSATLVKRTVCYDTGFMRPTLQVPAIVDAGLFEDEESQIKLSYHPSGFCQFSGKGLMSGVDEKGKPKGIGVWARN